MNRKYILHLDEEILQKAEAYAKEENSSLSDLIENYLSDLTRQGHKEQKELSPIAKSLKGSFKYREGTDYKKDIEKELEKKHL